MIVERRSGVKGEICNRILSGIKTTNCQAPYGRLILNCRERTEDLQNPLSDARLRVIQMELGLLDLD